MGILFLIVTSYEVRGGAVTRDRRGRIKLPNRSSLNLCFGSAGRIPSRGVQFILMPRSHEASLLRTSYMIADTYVTSVLNLVLPEFVMDSGLPLGLMNWAWRFFISPQNADRRKPVQLGEMGAEFGAFCRHFLLPLYPC